MINKVLDRLEVLAGITNNYEEVARGISDGTWDGMNGSERRKYVKEHPTSRFAKDPKYGFAKQTDFGQMRSRYHSHQHTGHGPGGGMPSRLSFNMKLNSVHDDIVNPFKDVDFKKLKSLEGTDDFEDYLNNTVTDRLDGSLPSDWYNDNFSSTDDLKAYLQKRVNNALYAQERSDLAENAILKPSDIEKGNKIAAKYKGSNYSFTGKDRAFAENMFKEYLNICNKLDPKDKTKGVSGIKAMQPLINKLSSGKLDAFKSILEEENFHTANKEIRISNKKKIKHKLTRRGVSAGGL